MSTKKTKSAGRQSAAKTKGSAAKNSSAGKAGGKSKGAGVRARVKITVQDSAFAAEPVVYQTLRERVNAVDANVGETQKLSDFLKTRGW